MMPYKYWPHPPATPFKWPSPFPLLYSKSNISMSIHRLGKTLLIDELSTEDSLKVRIIFNSFYLFIISIESFLLLVTCQRWEITLFHWLIEQHTLCCMHVHTDAYTTTHTHIMYTCAYTYMYIHISTGYMLGQYNFIPLQVSLRKKDPVSVRHRSMYSKLLYYR